MKRLLVCEYYYKCLLGCTVRAHRLVEVQLSGDSGKRKSGSGDTESKKSKLPIKVPSGDSTGTTGEM